MTSKSQLIVLIWGVRLQDMLCSHNNEGMLLHQNPIFRPHKEEGRDAHPPLLPSQSVRVSIDPVNLVFFTLHCDGISRMQRFPIHLK